MNVEYLDEITAETLFGFISSLGDVKDITKQSKLRVIRANELNRPFCANITGITNARVSANWL